jgi:hypothetical protein
MQGKFASLQAKAVSVCKVMSSPTLYVNQRIIVHGLYFSEPHQRLLYDHTCPDLSLRVSHSLQRDGDHGAELIVERFRKKHQTVKIPVIYSGVLTAAVLINGCTRPSCYTYSLEESQLLAASSQSYMRRDE